MVGAGLCKSVPFPCSSASLRLLVVFRGTVGVVNIAEYLEQQTSMGGAQGYILKEMNERVWTVTWTGLLVTRG